jgi:L-asparaginase
MNEAIYYAREVQKIHSAGLCAFASPNRPLAGAINHHTVTFYAPSTTRHTVASAFSLAKLDAATWPRVEIVYAHANMPADIIDYLTSRVAGIVLAGVGEGNAGDAAIKALARAAAKGLAVVRASRNASAWVARNIELDDDALGFIAAGDLHPAKARILLMCALPLTRDVTALQRCFDQY